MTALTLDTLRYTKRLIAAGVSREQAEAQAEALSEAVADTIATKSDIAGVRLELRDAKYDLLKWFIGISVLQTVAVIATVVRLSTGH